MVFLIANADEIAKGCGSRATNILPARPVRKQVHEKAGERNLVPPALRASAGTGRLSRPGSNLLFLTCFLARTGVHPRLKSGPGSAGNTLSIMTQLIKPDHALISLSGMIFFGTPARFPLSDYARVPAHDSLQMKPKYEDAFFDTHRQIRGFVYTWLSGSNLRS